MAKVIKEQYTSCDCEGTNHLLTIIECGAVTKVPVRKTYEDGGEFTISLKRPYEVYPEQRKAIEKYCNLPLQN